VIKRGTFHDVFRDIFTALTIDLIGIVAGIILIRGEEAFTRYPWIMCIYPAILGVRGAINGMICGKISTSLHLGILEGQEGIFLRRVIIEAALLLSVTGGMIIGLVGWLVTGSALSLLADSLTLAISVMFLATSVLAPLSIALGSFLFRRGHDPDAVLYPIMSTLSDIFATALYIVVIALYLASPLVVMTLGIMASLFALHRLKDLVRNYLSELKEMFIAVLMAISLESMAGSALVHFKERVIRSGMLMIYPVLIDALGDVGSAFGSMATTRLTLGTIEPSLSELTRLKLEGLAMYLAFLLLHLILGLITIITTSHRKGVSLLLSPIVAALAGFPVMAIISYSIAILTFKHGLDPDNFVNPLESSIADVVATLCMVLGLFVSRLLYPM